MSEINDLKLAVLIDADNISYKNIKGIMEEITKYGTPTIKRIYGDWTAPTVSGWKNVLLENAITPIQQYSYTTGKNSTDSALIIDAMDILYMDRVEGFCILSSDSDFTRLATRIRESGLKVYGFGERKTPEPFRVSCDKFTYVEIIPTKSPVVHERDEHYTAQEIETPLTDKIDQEIIELIASSVEDIADEHGWAFLAGVGNLIIKKKPDFDARNYGFSKLTPLIKSLDRFEIDARKSNDSNVKLIYIRNKD
jgi:uncharacterized LabA/DUF88 family protein